MLQPMPAGLEAHVVRYDVTRLRLAQLLVPFVALVSIVARRFPGSATVAAAVVLQVGTLLLFWRARHSFGRQRVRASAGAVTFADQHLTRTAVARWTMAGTTARLYGQARSFRLRAYARDAEALRGALEDALGPCTVLRRRGSPRARLVALVVGALGVAAVGVAFAVQMVPLILAGVLATVFGFATLGALSQRVVD